MRRFKALLAHSALGLVVVGLQGLILLGREDHRVELARLFNEDGIAPGLRAQADIIENENTLGVLSLETSDPKLNAH